MLPRFTVNPTRRIRQHNGEISAGAHKTKSYVDTSNSESVLIFAFRLLTNSRLRRAEQIVNHLVFQGEALGYGPGGVWLPNQGTGA